MSLQHHRPGVMRIMATSPVVRHRTARSQRCETSSYCTGGNARWKGRQEVQVRPCSPCIAEAVRQCAELRRAELR